MLRQKRTIIGLLVTLGTSMVAMQANAQGAMLVEEEFHAAESGGALIQFWTQLGTGEAAVIITATCAGFGIDCSQSAATATAAAKKNSKPH